MATVGIICEYNPFHLGHLRQMQCIRHRFGPDTGIICAMSGNFVQRGAPALLDKSLRAQAAVSCGADLVLELPITAALSSAEGFALGGVKLLSPLCDTLCFGAESADGNTLLQAAQALLSPEFSSYLRRELESGSSFPLARQNALEAMGLSPITEPNDILAVEYCKALLTLGSPMVPFPIHRPGSYHASTPDPVNPSATAVRALMESGETWAAYVPTQSAALFDGAPLHTLAAGERAVLGKLRTMSDSEFEALPFGSEGLWRKLMHECRRQDSLEDILRCVKSKRYTRTRLDRMVMCAYLGITRDIQAAPVPYTRVLAFSDRGRNLLKKGKDTALFLNAGASFDHPYWALEQRSGALYGLFRTDKPDGPDMEKRRRIRYVKDLSET